MRVIIKTSNLNPIPEIVFHGLNRDFVKKGFLLINKMAHNNYKVTWKKDLIIFEKDNEVVFFQILNMNSFYLNLNEFPQCGILINQEEN